MDEEFKAAFERLAGLGRWIGTYILNGTEPVPVDTMTWASWFQTNDRHVSDEMIGDFRVSTVFLGLDHNIGGGKPHLFETMVFRGTTGTDDLMCERCSTWEEARAMHLRAVARVIANEFSQPS